MAPSQKAIFRNAHTRERAHEKEEYFAFFFFLSCGKSLRIHEPTSSRYCTRGGKIKKGLALFSGHANQLLLNATTAAAAAVAV